MSLTRFYHGKWVWIIGGSEGIGLAAAQELFALGAHVLIASRSAEKLKIALRQIETARQQKDQQLVMADMDVADDAKTQEHIPILLKRYGVPDILINSAGYAHPGYLENLDMAAIRGMMDVNYFGTVHTVKAVLPAMRTRGHGHIVNVSSIAGYVGVFGYTGYCASKFAVLGFSQALRHEVAPYGITVSVLCPPNTRTPGLERENRIKPKEVLALEEKAGTVSAQTVAHALIKAIPRKPFLIHPTPMSQLTHAVMRLCPALMDLFLRRPAISSGYRG